MTGWAEFITARLDEWEAAAKAATRGPWRIANRHYGNTVVGADNADIAWPGYWERGDKNSAHITAHDPARVLRQAAAMRKLLNLAEYPCGEDCLDHGNDEHVAQEVPGIAIRRILASIWDDHPDYPEAGK